MFNETIHPLDLVLAVLLAALPGGAILYWLAINGRLPFDFLTGLLSLVTAAAVMLAVIGGMIGFAVWFFGPRK